MKENQPLVSIIITTKNSSRTLDKCLETIKNQDYPNIELIVVDNKSSDKTVDIALKYTSKVLVYGPERSAQRNFGVKNSSGNLILVHDSDIYFHPSSVSECVNLVLSKGADAVILPEKSVGEGFWTKVKEFERSFYLGNDLIEAPRFFKKDIYQKLGGYDEDLTGPEDWDLSNKIRMNKYKVLRAKNLILHDEGKIDLFGSSKKKKYYSKDMFEKYANRYPEIFKLQMSFINRFPLQKILTKGFFHPILLLCMILMKGLEYLNTKIK